MEGDLIYSLRDGSQSTKAIVCGKGRLCSINCQVTSLKDILFPNQQIHLPDPNYGKANSS